MGWGHGPYYGTIDYPCVIYEQVSLLIKIGERIKPVDTMRICKIFIINVLSTNGM